MWRSKSFWQAFKNSVSAKVYHFVPTIIIIWHFEKRKINYLKKIKNQFQLLNMRAHSHRLSRNIKANRNIKSFSGRLSKNLQILITIWASRTYNKTISDQESSAIIIPITYRALVSQRFSSYLQYNFGLLNIRHILLSTRHIVHKKIFQSQYNFFRILISNWENKIATFVRYWALRPQQLRQITSWTYVSNRKKNDSAFLGFTT